MKKKEKVQLVLTAAVVAVTAVILFLRRGTGEEEAGRIWIGRPESGSRQVELLLQGNESEHLFSMNVEAKRRTAEELEEAFSETIRLLEEGLRPETIRVTEKLALAQMIEETGVKVRWQSSDEEVIRRDGTIQRGGLTEPTEVTLCARLTLEEECREVWFPVTVLPYTPESEEARYYEAEEVLLSLEAETEEEAGFFLPEKVEGITVSLPEKTLPVGALFAAAVVLLPLLVVAAKHQEKEKERKERERVFLEGYPRLITKLTLYVGAGMSLRGAWERIGSEYRDRTGREKKNPVYEEVLVLTGELRNGKSEAGVYEAFGRRVGLKPYLRCAALLISQLQKGSGGLREGLEAEVRLAWELHREQAEKKGEEAQTKLLFPMMGMLFLVLAIVMLPAFLSMGL